MNTPTIPATVRDCTAPTTGLPGPMVPEWLAWTGVFGRSPLARSGTRASSGGSWCANRTRDDDSGVDLDRNSLWRGSCRIGPPARLVQPDEAIRDRAGWIHPARACHRGRSPAHALGELREV